MGKCIVVVSVLLVGSICFGAKLPSNYPKCDLKAADVDECLVKAFQVVVDDFTKAVPEIGLPSMDPLHINEMNIGAGTGAVAVNQEYHDLEVYGLKDSKVTKLKFDFDKKVMEWALQVPEVKMKAMYKVSGKVLLLPVTGTGPGSVIFERVNARMVAPFEIVEKKGKQFLKVKNSQLTMIPEHVFYNYENLFNGDKELGDNINRVLNENWKEIYEEVEKGFEEAYVAVVESVTNSVFGRVPLSELFLNQS